jgi:probable F420-dependent oxidoreductase
MKLGKLGVWAAMDPLNAAGMVDFAQRVEKWGYSALWIPEGIGRDAFVASGWLLANTKKLIVATGIANLYARHALTAVSAQRAVAEQSGGRFLLGLGVSHGPIVEGMRGQVYEKPIPTMKAYLTAMAKAKYTAPQPPEKPKTIIAALGPKMLEVAGTLADGAHPYNVTPEHTAEARKIMGPGKLLCPEVMVLLEKDASTARAIGRKFLSNYLGLPNYRNNFLRMGFSADDVDVGGGSNKLIDAIIAWGDEKAIRARVQQHWDAGADHVCIQSVVREGYRLSKDDEKIFELMAPG